MKEQGSSVLPDSNLSWISKLKSAPASQMPLTTQSLPLERQRIF